MISSIEREGKLLKAYVLCSSFALVIVCVMGFQSIGSRKSLADRDVLHIVDDQGHKLIVLANRDRFPLPVINGEEYP